MLTEKVWLKTIFDSVQSGILIIDPENHTIVDINPYATALFGDKKENIIGSVCHKYICPAETGMCPITDLKQNIDNSERMLIKADMSTCPVVKTVAPIQINGKIFLVESIHDNSKSKHAEEMLQKNRERLEKINDCLSSLGPDQDANINRLTALAGELLSGICALYNRLENGFLYSAGQWQSPPGFKAKDKPHGHICYDVIKEDKDDSILVPNLPDTPYMESDPNVREYSLKTYFGHVVRCEGNAVGSLCVVYQSDYQPTDEDRRILSIISNAIGNEDRRKRSEEELRASQRQLAMAMDIAHLVHWEADIDTRIFTFDHNFYALYGTTAEHEGGLFMPVQEYAERFVHPEEANLVAEEFAKAIATDDPNYCGYVEHRIIRADGQERIIAVRYRVIKNELGRTIGTYGANQDITEWKHAVEALRESEERFRRMFEENVIGMAMSGPDFHFIRVNPAFCRMLGYTDQELSRLTFRDITHSDHIKQDSNKIDDMVTGKISMYQTEKRYVRKDKGLIWGSTTINITRDKDGRFMYFFVIVEDITQRKKSEEEKARLESQLMRAQKMEAIGTLTGGIAHDFNNILTALVGYASLLQMKIDNGILRTYVDQVLSASNKAADLIQSLLAFSRQQAINLKPINLNEIVTKTEKLLKRLITEDITLRADLAPEDVVILADKTQIDQILFNLVTNARDAMPHGGILSIKTVPVELDEVFILSHGFGEPGRYALLSISDTGTGMNEATREKIFDPFFTTKEVGKGTGLGLSTVYGIVKQHGGYITVYSEPNMGTTINIYLPEAISDPEDAVPDPDYPKRGKETILIAEDNEGVRDLITEVLRDSGYNIVEAIDGEDAIEKFKNSDNVDLLIFDSVMPKKNGRETYDEIQKIKPGVKVIFTSGYTRDIILDKGIEDKKFDFISKPVSPAELLQMVREVLDRKENSFLNH
jgi:PAS domain S-box-containing protein